MRIVYLSDSVVPSTSANSVHVMKMCQAFAEIGNEVELIAYQERTGTDPFDYYDVSPGFTLGGIPNTGIPGVRRVLRATNGFYAVAKSPPSTLIYGRDLYSVYLSALTQRPVIYESHMAPRRATDRILTRRLLKRKNLVRVVLITASLADEFRRQFPFAHDKILVAHDGADRPIANAQTGGLDEWPGRPGVAQFGYVGSLYPGKGSETVVELAKRLPQYDFHIVGGKPDEIERIRSRSEILNLFLHGYVEHHQVKHYLARFDVALLPPNASVKITRSIDIGQWMSPLKLFEYMAANLPIIGSKLPVIEEVLQDGVNAVLVSSEDIDAWTVAAVALASDQSRRVTIASRAYSELESTYTWKARATRVLEGLQR